MAEELGPTVEVRGEPAHAFPGPSRLLELREFPGLTPVKVERLKSLAETALEGKLDAGYLRSLPVE
jgi:DNA-3-methyladenine glycosylase II